MDRMIACNPHFVRCIKPNTNKAPQDFNDGFVLAQLRYTGASFPQVKSHVIVFQVCSRQRAFAEKDTPFVLDLKNSSNDSASWHLDHRPKLRRGP